MIHNGHMGMRRGSHAAQRAPTRSGWRIGVVVLAAAAILAPVGWLTAGALGGQNGQKRASLVVKSAHRDPSPDPIKTTTAITNTVGDAVNLVAELPESVQGYASPGGPPTQMVPGSWYGVQSDLPVVAETKGWYEVRLAQRPNESESWIPSTGITLSVTPYRIVVDLSTMHLELFNEGNLVLDAPAGIGTPTDPTPTGQFFVAFFAQAPSAGYGPFVLVTSAHSDTITDWESSGDAIVAIHGPIGADAAIGTTGAAISHGCVRLHDSDLQQLSVVPPGSPISIIN